MAKGQSTAVLGASGTAPPDDPSDHPDDLSPEQIRRDMDHVHDEDGVALASVGRGPSSAAAGADTPPPEFDELDEPFFNPLPAEMAAHEFGRGEGAEDDDSQQAGFDPSRELPDVDGQEVGEEEAEQANGKGSASGVASQLGRADPAAWNSRTRKMYKMLKGAYQVSSDKPLSYNAMISGTRGSAQKRKVVAGCFQELLFLTTHGIIELQQRKPYADILVSKTELFDTIAS